ARRGSDDADRRQLRADQARGRDLRPSAAELTFRRRLRQTPRAGTLELGRLGLRQPAGQTAGSPGSVDESAHFLDPRPCPFEPRPGTVPRRGPPVGYAARSVGSALAVRSSRKRLASPPTWPSTRSRP